MRPYTLKTEIVSVDKSTKNVNKINAAYSKMAKTVSRESKIAGNAFNALTKKVGIGAKKMMVGLNNVDAGINRFGRNIKKKLGTLGVGIGLLAIVGSITSANIELDASIASLQAITGKTGEAFISFREEIDSISKSEKLFAGDTAKAFEIVGSAQPVLLKSAENLGLVTKAAIKLKKAGLMPIEDSAKAVTGTMNQFELGADQANRVINVLAAGAKEGSANIRELSESMDRVGAVAKASNMTLEQTGAAVELMSKFNLKGSEAGISLKSTILRLKSASLGFASGQFNLNDALAEYNTQMAAIKDPIKKAAKEEAVFGKIHILTGKILTENIGELDRLTKAMTGTNEATIQANINNNTFKNRLAEISAAWKNSITATEGQGKQMQFLKDLMAKVADNMDRIVSVAITLIKAFVAFKAIMIANKIAVVAYNVVLGIMGALSGTASLAIGTNAIALKAYTVATTIAAIAAKAWAIALNLGIWPITAIVAGIVLLAIGIRALVKNWDAVKIAMVSFYEKVRSNPLMAMLFRPILKTVEVVRLLIQSFKNIRNAFKFGSISDGFKEIGKSIINFLLLPFKMFLQAVSKIPKVGKFAEKALSKLEIKGFDTTGKDVDISKTSTKEEKLATAINKNNEVISKNSDEINKNTIAANKEWTGRFTTSILKDANISENSTGITQKEIATSAIVNEENITNIQKDVISSSAPQSIITPNSPRKSASKPVNGTITVNVVDNTGGQFALQVEGTGVEVITTGNG